MSRFTSACLSLLLAACGTSSGSGLGDPSGDGPGSGVENPGDGVDPLGPNFQVLMTDAPGDFDEVWVDIASVEVASDQGWLLLTDEPQSFDLLTLQDGVTAALGAADLAPGHYGQLRLIVASAFIVKDGASEDLFIPSGAQTGIKMNLDADIEDGMQYGVVIDFDAHQSIKKAGPKWLMEPVIAVVDVIATPVEPDPVEPAGDEPTGDEPTE